VFSGLGDVSLNLLDSSSLCTVMRSDEFRTTPHFRSWLYYCYLFSTVERTCKSRCGNGISIPCLRSALSIALWTACIRGKRSASCRE